MICNGNLTWQQLNLGSHAGSGNILLINRKIKKQSGVLSCFKVIVNGLENIHDRLTFQLCLQYEKELFIIKGLNKKINDEIKKIYVAFLMI